MKEVPFRFRRKPLELKQVELIGEWLINFYLFFERREFISLLASVALAAKCGLSVRSIILDRTILVFGDSLFFWQHRLAMLSATCLEISSSEHLCPRG